MAIQDYVVLCRAMYGCVGLCVAMQGYVGLCMVMYGYVGLCMAVYGYVGLHGFTMTSYLKGYGAWDDQPSGTSHHKPTSK